MQETTSSCLNPCSAPHHSQRRTVPFTASTEDRQDLPSLSRLEVHRGDSHPLLAASPPTSLPWGCPSHPTCSVCSCEEPSAPKPSSTAISPTSDTSACQLRPSGRPGLEGFQPFNLQKDQQQVNGGSPFSLHILQPALGSLSPAGPAPLTGTELRAALRGAQRRPDATSAAAERGAAVPSAAVSARAGAAPHRSARSDSPAPTGPTWRRTARSPGRPLSSLLPALRQPPHSRSELCDTNRAPGSAAPPPSRTDRRTPRPLRVVAAIYLFIYF